GASWVVLVAVFGAVPVSAAVLCVNKKGVVLRRDSECKRKEQGLQLSDFGAQGPKGDKGDPGPFVGTLPSGQTLRGAFFMNLPASSGGQEVGTSVSFGFQLASEPTVHFVTQGTTPPAECPGTSAAPAAVPGHFCMFENSASNATGQGICGIG